MKTKNIFFFIIHLIITFSCNAQVIYQKSLSNDDERVNDFMQFNDSTIYFTGAWRNCSNCPYSSILGKVDSEFNIDWSYRYSDTSIARNLILRNGEIVIYGSDMSDAKYQHFITKTDLDGNIIWSNSYGYFNGNSGKITEHNNGYLISGSALALDSIGNDSTLLNLISIDTSGIVLWTKSYFISDNLTVSGVIQLIDSTFLISCRFLNSVSNYFDSAILKIDNNGNLIWAHKYSTPANHLSFSTNPIVDNNKIYIGAALITNPLTHPFLMTLSDIGEVVNAVSYFRPAGGTSPYYLLKSPTNGKLFMTLGQGLIVIDSSSNFIESHTYIPNFPANSSYFKAIQTSDVGILMGGFNTGGNDIFIVKTDSLYNGGCGYYTINFTSTPEIIIDSTLNPIEVVIPINTSSRQTNKDTIPFTQNIYCHTATFTNDISENSEFAIFPNPVLSKFNLKINQAEKSSIPILKIFNSHGIEVFYIKLKEITETVNIDFLPSGVYIITVVLNNSVYHQKIIKL